MFRFAIACLLSWQPPQDLPEVGADGVFAVAPGILLRFEDCNLVNVTVPDGVEIAGGNLAHITDFDLGTLCDCDRCATAQQGLAAAIADGTIIKDEDGRILHDQMKALFAVRRLDPAQVAVDIASVQAANATVLAVAEAQAAGRVAGEAA